MPAGYYDGVPQFVLFHGGGLAGFAADDGRLLWRCVRPNTRNASSHTPIPRGDLILSPNGYGGGLALFKVVRGEGGFRAGEVSHQTVNLDAFQKGWPATWAIGQRYSRVSAPTGMLPNA